MESSFCSTVLERALQQSLPQIFNIDQGNQFTAQAFTTRLKTVGMQISIDGRGRVFDNTFIERIRCRAQYEYLYLHNHQTVTEVITSLTQYFRFFNIERSHQSLGYRTPAAVHQQL